MVRLQQIVESHRRLVLGAWLLLMVASVPFALRQEEGLTGGGFAVAGSDSAQVEQQLRSVPAQQRGVVLGAVLVRDRAAGQAGFDRALADLQRAVAKTPDVSLPRTSLDVARFQARRHPTRPVVVALTTTADEYRVPDVAGDLRERLHLEDGYNRGGVRMHLVGQGALWAGLVDLTKADLRQAEVAGFPLVALILLTVFGSLAAALLPLAVAATAVVVTGALIFGMSALTTMNVYVTNMAMMIGIGVAVDYSLFVVVRYREELAGRASRAHARAEAVATSGRAVMFSGLTVVAALASLLVVQTAVLRSMALAAMLIVLVSVALTLTLVPAMLALLGPRISARSDAARSRTAGRWQRWTRRVLARPKAAVAVATAVLVAMAAPALGLKLGDGALAQFSSSNETRRGFEAAASVTAPGRGSPIKILVAPSLVPEAMRTVLADRQVRRAGTRGRTRDGRVVILAEARSQGDSSQAKQLVERLRDQLGLQTLVGGNSAAQLDFDHEVLSKLWLVALLTGLVCFVLLATMLRSLVLTAKAVLTNLLSVAAAFGVLTVVFVWGVFDGLLGWQSPGYIDTFTVPLIVAAVFGLSMDYQVFLLSRIRERFLATGDTERSVSQALVASARTITGAAAVMVAVFAVFIGTGVPVIQQVGLGCAVAIVLDATLVRLVLVPAAMVLLGRWNWWWPGRQARAKAAAVAAALGVVLFGVGCGDSAEKQAKPKPALPVASTTVAFARVQVTPDRAGTPERPQPVKLDLTVGFRSPAKAEPPLLQQASIRLPAGTGLNTGARPGCPRTRLEPGGPEACPAGSITGRGRIEARADQAPARGTVIVINGGRGKVWLHTLLRNPVRQEGLVAGSIKPASGGSSELTLRFPEQLQTVGGVPIAIKTLSLQVGAGRWLTTSSCPANRSWAYRGQARFGDGSVSAYSDQVKCQPQPPN